MFTFLLSLNFAPETIIRTLLRHEPGSRELNTTLYKSCLVVLRVDHLPYAFFRSVNTGIMHETGITKSVVP